MGHPAVPENCDLHGVWISTLMMCSFILPNLCHMVVKMHWIPITYQLSQTFLETSAESLKTREEDKEKKKTGSDCKPNPAAASTADLSKMGDVFTLKGEHRMALKVFSVDTMFSDYL